MKKIIFLLILLYASSLLADSNDNTFDTFIDKQINVEAIFFDQNLSLDDKVKVKKKQSSDYQDFFLQYSTEKSINSKVNNPYRKDMNRVKIRIKSNRYAGNINAIKRDEVLLKNYSTRNALREMLNSIIKQTNSNSKAFFKEKVNEIIEKFFSSHRPLERSKYLSGDQNQTNSIVESIRSGLQNQTYLESVVNTFSSELIEDSSLIYRTSRIADSKILNIIYRVNKTSLGQELNKFLSPLHLDSAKLVLMLGIIVFIFIFKYIAKILVDRLLHYHKIKEDDIEYIHKYILKIFTMLASLVAINVTFVVLLGFDSQTINLTKVFATLYVILIALLLYRITSTIAYLKLEQMKNSKILKNEVVNLSIKVVHGVIVVVALIVILKIVGVNLTALLSGLGIAGAAVAFAAKDSIANIFGSISILLGDVFEQGDWIEAKDINGTVVEIGLRATTVRTFDNALISIPNSNLSGDAVINWSRRSVGRRIKMSIGVTYESDFGDIRKAIDDIREMLSNHPSIAQKTTSHYSSGRTSRLVSTEDYKGVKNTTLVYMDEFADSSINILIYCFSSTVVWDDWLRVKEDVMYKVEEILQKNNLEFAYPAMMLHKAKQE
ncbi:MAG: mechanosensitive ion channel family protein [Campylobacterota bacterium]|nr:mechanosensitive ion channel family protein [Campylobacterota bacterium]